MVVYMNAVKLTLRTLVAAAFILSFTYKIANPQSVLDYIAKLPVMIEASPFVSQGLGLLVVGLEGSVGFGLLIGKRTRLGFALGASLPLLFAVAVAPFYDQIGGDCSCFWEWVPFSPRTGLELIIRNVLLASLSLFAFQVESGYIFDGNDGSQI